MSYTVVIYPVELMHYIQQGGDWESKEAKSITFHPGTLERLTQWLEAYGYRLTQKRAEGRHYEKMFGTLPVEVNLYDTEVVFSCPYWEGFSEQVFEIRMDALELADAEELAFYDPQEDEWNQGLG